MLALGVLFLPLGLSAAQSDSASSVSFLQAPEGAKRISIGLAVLENAGPRQQGYLVQRSPTPLEEVASVPPQIADALKGAEFSAYEFGALPDGTRYLVALHENKSIKFLNRHEPGMWYARIYRVTSESDGVPELLREGFQSPGNDVTIPVELPLPGIGLNKVKSLRTEIGYSINGMQNSKPQLFSGRGSMLQLTGSHAGPNGKLTLTVTVPESMTVTAETQVSLQFQPLEPGLPEHTASGKVTDYLTLGAARFIITALEPDFSSATLAVVSGSLEQTLKQQIALGARMPAFSQVDLVARKTVTREAVLTKALDSAGVVFVFGDLPVDGGRFPNRMMGPSGVRGDRTSLPLPAAEIVEQLGVEVQPKPLVVLVTRQIGIDFLYEDLRNKIPDYLVLTDFADPLRTTFRLPQSTPGGGWYGPSYPGGAEEPSLRQLFNFPAHALSIAAFDRQGKVVYVKTDAAGTFLPSLAEARSALVELSEDSR